MMLPPMNACPSFGGNLPARNVARIVAGGEFLIGEVLEI